MAIDLLDEAHHALGRPDGPWVKPYRNHFVIGKDHPLAGAMRASALWREVGSMNAGSDSIFEVTPAGINAVWAMLSSKAKASGIRPYVVTADGCSPRTIMARSRAAAKAELWRELADAWDLPWPSFLSLQPRAVLAGEAA